MSTKSGDTQGNERQGSARSKQGRAREKQGRIKDGQEGEEDEEGRMGCSGHACAIRDRSRP
eukprot:754894-Hanusia_phi.AAC.2